jgi:hypothetical protein
MDPDPDPGGQKTCGSRSPTLGITVEDKGPETLLFLGDKNLPFCTYMEKQAQNRKRSHFLENKVKVEIYIRYLKEPVDT